MERSVELSRQRQNESGLSSEETTDMTEQIIKLKAMLSAKREQVGLLPLLVSASVSRVLFVSTDF